MLKIKDIKTFPTQIEFGNQLIVKVQTEDSKLYGWGASGLTSRELAVAGAIEHYKGFLIGRNALEIGAIWQELYRGQYFEGGRVLTAAISAIDIALYDIKGKYLGVPVYELLGGKQRDRIECFASLRFDSESELLTKAKKLKKAGFNAIRLYKAEESKEAFDARASIAEVVDWLPTLRKAMGNGMVIGLDYHSRLSVPETVSLLAKLPEGTLDFIEEPIRDESPSAYQELRKMVKVPFAIGEEFSSKWQFWPYLKDQITQFARLDVCNVGGITEAMKVAALAEKNYIDLMPHNPLGPICTAATIHVVAASPNVTFMEEINTPVEWCGTNSTDFYPLQPVMEGSQYILPTLPGLGVEFNEKLALETGYTKKEVPRLHKRDGSFTNW
ncbi:MAG: mandelate racemase/muconate lactonizing enzyme family protein [Bacteroidota bacterium]